MGDLDKKIAIVTGGAKGNGHGIALSLAKAGADVVIVDILEEEAKKTAEEIKALGREALALRVDTTNSGQVQEMVEEVIRRFGRIDILVNNVGVNKDAGQTLLDYNEKDWDDTFNINVKSSFLCTKAFAPYMVKQRSGKIINLASQAGKGQVVPSPSVQSGAYSATKSAIIKLTQVWAMGLAKYNINVNAICPGLLWTDLMRDMPKKIAQAEKRPYVEAEGKKWFEDRAASVIPLGRPQTPEDLGEMAVFLASDKGKNITGQAINVCGGMQMSF